LIPVNYAVLGAALVRRALRHQVARDKLPDEDIHLAREVRPYE